MLNSSPLFEKNGSRAFELILFFAKEIQANVSLAFVVFQSRVEKAIFAFVLRSDLVAQFTVPLMERVTVVELVREEIERLKVHVICRPYRFRHEEQGLESKEQRLV